MTTNIEFAPTTRKEIGKKKSMAERVQDSLEQDKQKVRGALETIFKTKEKDREILKMSELRAMGLDPDNMDLAKEVYEEMALQELDKIASTDELARIKLQNKIDVIKGIRRSDFFWMNMLLLSPQGIAKVAVEDAQKTRRVQESREKQEQDTALQSTRSRIRTKRPTITEEQLLEFQEQERIRKASEQGGGYAGVGQGEAPEEFVQAAGKEKAVARKGKGFETATGSFENKAEAFTEGMSLEKLAAQQFAESLMQGMNKKETSEFSPHTKRYLEQFDEKRAQWDEAIADAEKAGKTEKVEKLKGMAKRSAELDKELLQALVESIKNHKQAQSLE